MNDRYIIPRRLDDPELIGFWTLDEFAGRIIPFTWGNPRTAYLYRHRALVLRLVRTAKGESRTR